MACLYLTTPEYELVDDLVEEVLRGGLASSRLKVYSIHPERLRGLSVKPLRYRPPEADIVLGAAAGAGAGLLAGLALILIGFGAIPMLALVIAFGVVGVLLRLWAGHGLAGELYRLDDAIRQGDVVMVLEVDDERARSIGQGLKARHPRLAVLGTHTEGAPPLS